MYYGRLISVIFWTFILMKNFAPIMVRADIVTNEVLQTNDDEKHTCETDRECPDNMFCHEEVACIECFDCGKLNRRSRIRCAKSEADCGRCLPQFVNDTYVKGSSRWCNPIAEMHKVDNPGGLFNNFHWFAFSGLFAVVLLSFASYYCYTKKSRMITINDVERQNDNSQRRFPLPPQPPPYKEEADIEDNHSISCSFQIVEQQVEERSKAIPYFYGDDIRNDNAGDAVAPQNTNNTEPAPYFNIHEETTVPSPWTPGASYGQSSNEPSRDDRKEETAPKKRKRDYEDESGAAKKRSPK